MRPTVTDVAWSICHKCHDREHCKTAEPIEMPLGLWTLVGQRNHVLDGVQIPMRRGNFEGKEPSIVKYREYRPCAAAMQRIVK